MCMPMHAKARIWHHQISSYITLHFIFKARFSTEPCAHWLTGILLGSLVMELSEYAVFIFLYRLQGLKFGRPCLCDKHFANGVISPAPSLALPLQAPGRELSYLLTTRTLWAAKKQSPRKAYRMTATERPSLIVCSDQSLPVYQNCYSRDVAIAELSCPF